MGDQDIRTGTVGQDRLAAFVAAVIGDNRRDIPAPGVFSGRGGPNGLCVSGRKWSFAMPMALAFLFRPPGLARPGGRNRV